MLSNQPCWYSITAPPHDCRVWWSHCSTWAEQLLLEATVSRSTHVWIAGQLEMYLYTAVITTGAPQPGTLTAQQDASILLPPNVFSSTIQEKRVGLFFALYHTPALFPLRPSVVLPSSPHGSVADNPEVDSPQGGMTNSRQRTVVGSGVLATSLSSGTVTDVTPPIVIRLRLTGAPEQVRGGTEKGEWVAGIGGVGEKQRGEHRQLVQLLLFVPEFYSSRIRGMRILGFCWSQGEGQLVSCRVCCGLQRV